MINGFTVEIGAVSLASSDTSREVTAADGLTVKWFSHDAMGGCESAELVLEGDLVRLSQYMLSLRTPVNIIAPDGEPVWWGYVASAELEMGALTLTTSLDDMYNYVMVVYNRISPGVSGVGAQVTTSPAQDSFSIGVYGQKELKQTLSDAFDSQAISARDAILGITKFPQSSIDIGDSSGNETVGKITLSLRGWWNTLSWKYYQNSAGYIAYTDSGTGDRPFGAGDSIPRVAQSFVNPGTESWAVYSVRIKLAKANNPVDLVYLSLNSDTAGSPGAVLASTSIPGTSLSTSTDWVEFVLPTPVVINPGTTYWIQVLRSGADDATNYYVVDVNEALGYSGGVFKCYNGTSWIAKPGNDADMNFEVLGIQETTEQLKSIIKTSGQFFTGIRVDDASGVYTSQYRDGTQDAESYVTDLLNAGTSSKKRLLAEVTQNRAVRIYQEPSFYIDTTLMATGHGELYQGESPVPKWKVRPGMWVVPRDTQYGFIDSTRLSGINPMLIERTEFVVSSGSLRLTPRAQKSVWEIANGYGALK